jgi:hypothetical protein
METGNKNALLLLAGREQRSCCKERPSVENESCDSPLFIENENKHLL